MIIYLRKGKNNCTTAARKEESENVGRTTMHTPRSLKSRGAIAPGAAAEIAQQPMVKTVVMQVVPLQPIEDHSGADIHVAAHGGPHTRGG